MKGLWLTLSGVLLVSLLATPTLGAGWLWDIGNGIGFMAFAGLLYLSVSSGSGIDVQAHQVLGFSVLAVTTAHVFALLLIDAAVIEYIKPGAPVYMWAGIAGFVLLAVLIVVGLPEYRLRLHKRYAAFKYWHRALAITTIVAAAYHIVASGFYLSAEYQVVIFVVLTALVVLGYQRLGRGYAMNRRSAPIYIVAAALCTAMFAGIRNIPW